MLWPLLRAWEQEGIKVILFKGFYLAEFVYEIAAQRPYGDIDLLMKPEDAKRASLIAQSLGWAESWSLEQSLPPSSHELLQLFSPDRTCMLEAHRFILQSSSCFTSAQARITYQAWESAREFAYEDICLYTLAPKDHFLIGLVLNRYWSADNWQLKAQDWVDAQMLTLKFALKPEDLKARASRIRLQAHFEYFLIKL